MTKTWDELMWSLQERKKSPLYRVKIFFRRGIRKIQYLRTDLRAAYERARYGWSGWDFLCLGYDKTSMKWLGEAMIELGKVAHGAPHSYITEYGDPQGFHQWANDLASYGCDLINASKEENLPENYSSMSETARRAWFDEQHRLEKARAERATAALHWVADNWQSLWD